MPQPQPQQHRASLSGLLLLAAPVKRRRACAAAVAVATLIPLASLFSAAALLWNRQAVQGGYTPGHHASSAVLLAMPHGTMAAHCSSSSSSVQPPRSTAELGAMLQAQGLTTGAEVGMHVGRFASELLDAWPSADHYYMVYASGQQQPTSKPAPNNPQHLQQHKVLGMASEATEKHARRVVWLHEWTSAASVDAAALIQEPLEFVFVNAALDVCGVLADVRAWWQHLAPGSIMAGHDLLRHATLALQQRAQQQQQERALVCADGARIDSPAAAQAQLAAFVKQQPGAQLVRAVLDSSSSGGNGTSSSKQHIWLVRKPGAVCSSSSSSSSRSSRSSSAGGGGKPRPEGRQPVVHADPLAHLLSQMRSEHQPDKQQPSSTQQQLRRLHNLAEQQQARVHV